MKKNQIIFNPSLFSSSICFGQSFVLDQKLPTLIRNSKTKFALITDENLKSLYRQKLETLNIPIFSFAAGEQSKTRETKEIIENQLLINGFGKNTHLLAFGGGVVTDLVGFVASTYCRGVAFSSIPTSLMAMVDASIGGKTSVNTPQGKNLIGAIHFPKNIFIDYSFLETLPEPQWLNGIAEILKYGCIYSKTLFDWMRQNDVLWKQKIVAIISECVRIKNQIIKRDPFEKKGIRRILNFGHTIAHALELLEDYHMEHGHAVMIGMMGESYISRQLNLLTQEDFNEIIALLNHYFPSTQKRKKYSEEALFQTMTLDKKAINSSPRFVLLKTIGKVHSFRGKYCAEIPQSLVKEVTNFINEIG